VLAYLVQLGVPNTIGLVGVQLALEAFVSPEIRGKTLGILGYGAIGRQVARLAAACGMHVLATKRRGYPATFDGWSPVGTGDPDGSIPERFYDLDELHPLLAACDAMRLSSHYL
jgi:lactate dehydrogenase-like 2-hydroxyacid dehydrogenase